MIVVRYLARSSLRTAGMPCCRSPREQLHPIDQLARSDSADTDLPDRLVVRKHQLLTTKCRVVPDTVSGSLLGWSGPSERHRSTQLLRPGRCFHSSRHRLSVDRLPRMEAVTRRCRRRYSCLTWWAGQSESRKGILLKAMPRW